MSPEIIDILEVNDEIFTTESLYNKKFPLVVTKVYKSYGKVHGIQVEFTGFDNMNNMYRKKRYISRDDLLHRLEDASPDLPEYQYYQDDCVKRKGYTLIWDLERKEKEKEKEKIKALEQKDILDKIIAEIEEIETYDGLYIDRAYVLEIIDKYKESEGKE